MKRRLSVSPAYGYVLLALVKHSNEGGPGPRYNMKEDPGSSILSMLVVYGYHLVPTPPPAKMKIETRLGGNHTSASDLRSEAIDWARGGCGDHFGLFRASLRGQAAELEASAGQPARLL